MNVINQTELKKKRLEIDVDPVVFRWLFATSGLRLEDIRKELKIDLRTFNQWETGKKKITLEQAELLAKHFKRPLSAFFLPEPPEEPKIKDFRLAVDRKPFSQKVFFAIRTAQRLQNVASMLMKNLEIDIKPKTQEISTSDDYANLAKKEREASGVSIDEQLNWFDNKEAFSRWREYIESKNIIVFQIPMSSDEVRGFSLIDKEPFVIVVSESDDANAKIFTLIHEYAHTLLRQSSVCKPEVQIVQRKDSEQWCNYFSGEFLLPSEFLNKIFKEFSNLEVRQIVSRISNKYKISKYSTLFRLRNQNLIDSSDYNREVKFLKAKQITRGGRRLPAPRRVIQERGRKFVSIVFQNADRKLITTGDILDYLSIKTKHLEDVRSSVKRNGR